MKTKPKRKADSTPPKRNRRPKGGRNSPKKSREKANGRRSADLVPNHLVPPLPQEAAPSSPQQAVPPVAQHDVPPVSSHAAAPVSDCDPQVAAAMKECCAEIADLFMWSLTDDPRLLDGPLFIRLDHDGRFAFATSEPRDGEAATYTLLNTKENFPMLSLIVRSPSMYNGPFGRIVALGIAAETFETLLSRVDPRFASAFVQSRLT